MRRSFAVRRSMRWSTTCTIQRWTTAPRDAGGAPTDREPTTENVPCRAFGRDGGDVVQPATAAAELLRARLTVDLPRDVDIAEGDQIILDGRTYDVAVAAPGMPTNLYRQIEVDEVR